MQEITSINNARIKQVVQLQKKSALRNELKEFVIEGVRELTSALKNGYNVKTIFFLPELLTLQNFIDWKKTYNADFQLIAVTKKVYQKIAYRNSTEGVVAVAQMKEHDLAKLNLPENPLILVTESIEKPGNVGAMLRSVDGAGVDAMIMVNPVVDLYNPNVIRASLGTVFSNKIAICSISELAEFLQSNHIKFFTASLQNANEYHVEDYTSATAIAVGAEDKGLSRDIRKVAGKSINIAMNGQADSLNVSVSAAVLLYEAVRQRKTKNM